ncbi:MAG TPA: MOP flippase family protein [Candidatus Polarisedimenticolia bacterium]|nr:MOP flippase family protein [Candidatus Polarisedimenticolia bacterium]
MNSAIPAANILGQRVLFGASWSAIARVTIQLSALAASTVVARRVPPNAFGIVGMAALAIGLISLFRDLGTAAAVIQKRDLNQQLLSSLFWVNVGIGFAGTALCFLSAPVAARIFREPAVIPVVRVLSVSFLISSLSNIHTALLNRSMAFRKISLIDISSSLAGLGVVVTLACLHAGVWSLVAGSLTSAAISSLLFCAISEWQPRLLFSWTEVRSVMNFGLNLSAFNLLNYFARNSDNAIVGRYLGSAALGFYQLAYNIMLFPVMGIAQVLCQVMFPAFSEIQHDNERFRRVYLRTCSSIALITFPLMAGAAILAEPLIKTVYGPRWVNVIPVLTILAPVGLVQSILTTSGIIYTAKGRTDLMFKVGGVASVLYVISFFAGLPWGIRGVALSYAICVALLLLPYLYIAFRLIDLRLIDLLHALKGVAVSTILMAVVVIASRRAVAGYVHMPPVVDLFLFTALGAAVYGVSVFLQRLPVLLDLSQMLASSWPRLSRRAGQIA